jgi:hypothetical protein
MARTINAGARSSLMRAFTRVPRSSANEIQTLLAGLQPFHQCFARISVAVDYGQGATFQRQRRSVLEQHSTHRAIASIAFVVDRNALAFHPRLQNRNQRRSIARNGHGLIDPILKQVTDFAAGRGSFHARVRPRDCVAELRAISQQIVRQTRRKSVQTLDRVVPAAAETKALCCSLGREFENWFADEVTVTALKCFPPQVWR